MKKHALVVGGARSGIAAAKLLMAEGWQVTLSDMSAIPEKEELTSLGIAVQDRAHPKKLERIYDIVVKNPGISLHSPFIEALAALGNTIICEVELAYRLCPHFHYGAVTGTNGKTTTTTLLHACLKMKDESAQIAGNIGIPLSAAALVHRSECLDVALELSNFQLLSMPSFAPQVSVILNLTPDHLDFMDSLEHYYQSKTNIFAHQDKSSCFLRNVDDEAVMAYTKDVPCRIIDYSMQRQDVDLYLREDIVYFQDVPLFACRQLPLVGAHNIQNAMVAAGMAYLMGVTPAQIASAISQSSAVEHRIEYVKTVHGVRYYNDSKGTNVDATRIAVAAFDSPVILLAGGKDKHTGFDGLQAVMANVKSLICFGQTKEQLAVLHPSAVMTETLEEAVAYVAQIAKEQDIVLFSPACSSFDQFKDYEERGRMFKQYVFSIK